MKQVFIDGSAGTTGLRIYERLAERKDLHLITLPDELRKDPAARKEALTSADVAFLCLPDAAAIDAVQMLEGASTIVIDTSTAHRTAPGWEYGFPELEGRRERIAASKRIANPGCHASGFVALIEPLVRFGILKEGARLSCFSLTGYSGGGKKMIAEYESPDRNPLFAAPRVYGLSQAHKHLPEMAAICKTEKPLFCPTVAPFYAGMEVTVPLFAYDIKGTADDIRRIYTDYYKTGLVHFMDGASEDGFLSAQGYTGRDDMEITLHGNSERILLSCRFDNLGKGASGAAIQNMNIVLGVPEETGLCVKNGKSV